MNKLARDKYLLDDEFARMTYAARTRPHVHARRDFSMLAVGGLCGLRVSELVGIRFADLGRLTDRPATLGVWTAKKKGGRRYDQVLVPPGAAAPLLKYIRAIDKTKREPWMRIFPLTTRQANRVFKHYAAIAGLNQRYSIHALRHFCGVRTYAQTKDVYAVKTMLRHDDIRSTMIYVHTVDYAAHVMAVDMDLESFQPNHTL